MSHDNSFGYIGTYLTPNAFITLILFLWLPQALR